MEMSVMGRVWSERLQKAVGTSFWRSLETRLRDGGGRRSRSALELGRPRRSLFKHPRRIQYSLR